MNRNIGIYTPKRKPSELWFVRQERIKREGSPYYTWTVPVTVAGARSAINIEQQFPQAKKYEPLDWLEIINNDTVVVTLILDSADTLRIINGTIRISTEKAFRHLAIRNEDAVTSTTLDKIIVTLRREPLTSDKWVRSR